MDDASRLAILLVPGTNLSRDRIGQPLIQVRRISQRNPCQAGLGPVQRAPHLHRYARSLCALGRRIDLVSGGDR